MATPRRLAASTSTMASSTSWSTRGAQYTLRLPRRSVAPRSIPVAEPPATYPLRRGAAAAAAARHFTATAARTDSARAGAVAAKSAHDVVFVTALRTPVAKMKRGFAHMHPEELLAFVLRRTRERLEARGVTDLSRLVDDVCTGTVLMELGGAKSGRLAALHAGLPVEASYYTVNRQCASSLQSINNIAHSIALGEIRGGIAAGVESMTRDWGTRAMPVRLSPELARSPSADARDCLLSMGVTSENVAQRYGVERQRQDEYAVRSHARAVEAREGGWLRDEIEAIEVRCAEQPTDADAAAAAAAAETRLVEHDEGVRADATYERLSKLAPAFREDGRSTAGNSSQVSDGAVALTLARRDVAESMGLEVLGKWVGAATAGVRPDEMGIGPAVSTPKLLQRFGLDVGDIDLWEINEAFASQTLMTIDTLGLDEERVNVKGGAIAIGHPLGASGGRLVASLLYELRRRGETTGVATLCCGTGYGVSTLVVAE